MKDILRPKTTSEWILTTAILLSVFLWAGGELKTTKARPSASTNVALSRLPKKAPSATAPDLPSESVTITPAQSASNAQVRLDPTFAAALAQEAQIPDPELRRAALVKECFQQADHDPAGAVVAAQRWSLDQGAGRVLEELTQRWASVNLHGAYTWVDRQPPGTERDGLVARVALVWSQSRPAEAATWLIAETQPGPDQEEAIMSVVHQWGLHDVTGASNWVAQFPAGDFQQRAIRELQGIAAVQKSP